MGIVAAYLSSLADSGRKASTIGRRAAAIGYHHKMAGHEPPTNQEAVKTVLRGIRRTIGTARAGKAPATADLIGQMLALCPDTMIGKRDRALLCLGFAGAFRRSELCALAGRGSDRGSGRAARPDPALEGRPGRAGPGGGDSPRLQAAPGRGGADVAGRGLDQRPGRCSAQWGGADGYRARPWLTTAAARIVKRYARRVGLDPAPTAGHSLRSGFLTSAAETGASVWKLSEVSRHKSLDTLRGYVRRVDLFKEHAGAAFL